MAIHRVPKIPTEKMPFNREWYDGPQKFQTLHDFELGDRVTVNVPSVHGLRFGSPSVFNETEVGVVVEKSGNAIIRIDFPSQEDWAVHPTELMKVGEAKEKMLQEGDIVRDVYMFMFPRKKEWQSNQEFDTTRYMAVGRIMKNMWSLGRVLEVGQIRGRHDVVVSDTYGQLGATSALRMEVLEDGDAG